MLNLFSGSLLHLIYPNICISCYNALTTQEEHICFICETKLPLTGYASYNNNELEKLLWGRCEIKSATALLYFDKKGITQKLIHQIKYKGNKGLATYLGQKLGYEMAQSSRFENIDAIIALPMHHAKQIKRGYNQCELIAQAVSHEMNVPIMNGVIEKTKNITSQTFKSRVERWKNTKEAFNVKHPQHLLDKNILIIDDVVTTGSTLDAVSNCIKNVINAKINIASLAFTPTQSII